MTKIALKLAGKGKDELLSVMKDLPEYEVAAFTDKRVSLWNTIEKGIKVCSVYEIMEMYSQGKVDAVVIDGTLKLELLEKMTDELMALGIKAEDILIATPDFYENPCQNHLVAFRDYHCLPYIEYHVADHCNLNCRGCVHFSPMADGEKFADYEQVKNDLYQLKKIVPYIEQIHILGGEPLLNKELWRYLKLTRSVYPYAELYIITNGLLLGNMTEELMEAVRENNVKISVSLYPPMYKNIRHTVELVKAQGIPVSVSDAIDKFSYTFDEQGGHLNGVKRIHCTCPNLYKGRLSLCPIIAYMEYFNKAFGKDIDVEKGKIDIYDGSLTFDVLKRQLSTPIGICDNCLFVSAEDAVSMEWSQTDQVKYEDYYYREKVR